MHPLQQSLQGPHDPTLVRRRREKRALALQGAPIVEIGRQAHLPAGLQISPKLSQQRGDQTPQDSQKAFSLNEWCLKLPLSCQMQRLPTGDDGAIILAPGTAVR
jgi:hypothetical protein